MEQEILHKILDKIDALDVKVSNLDNRVSGLDNKVSGLDNKVSSLDNRMSNFESTQDKLLIKVLDIDAHLETLATKKELYAVKDDIFTTIDRFAKLHETVDQEMVMLRSRYDRLEDRLVIVEHKLGLTV